MKNGKGRPSKFIGGVFIKSFRLPKNKKLRNKVIKDIYALLVEIEIESKRTGKEL